MPELPEVEALRLGLVKYLIGNEILNVSVALPKLVSAKGTKRQESDFKTKEFIDGLLGKKIVDIKRRAKTLIFSLEPDGFLLVHLKMTGQLVFVSKTENLSVIGGHPIQESENNLPNKHTYITFALEDGNLYYNDVRQFGYLLYYKTWQEILDDKHWLNLGLEPLDSDFNYKIFKQNLLKFSGVLKKIFLDQKAVVGLGNIYADEVCFMAKVRPNRKISSLNESEIKKIHQAIIEILPKAVSLGGSSVANYLLADGSRGNYALHHKVYGRGNKECLVCGQKLEKIQLAGRTTVFCLNCQK